LFEPRLAVACRLGLVALGATLAGCAGAGGQLHADFEKLRPATIAVPQPENRTVVDLEKAVFGGPLQRHVIGAPVFDVPALLGQSLRNELHGRGYQTVLEVPPGRDFRLPLPQGTEPPGFDAVLYASIQTWHAKTRPPYEARMSYRLELHHVPTGTVLYEGTFKVAAGGEGRSSPEFLGIAIRNSVRRALAPLPAGG
jgi:hypothetical protein